jgi:hypothetical protein
MNWAKPVWPGRRVGLTGLACKAGLTRMEGRSDRVASLRFPTWPNRDARAVWPGCEGDLTGMRRSELEKNCHQPKISQFAAKTSPTATKLCKHDYKAVGELPLRGHRPIWSQTTGNRRGTKNTCSCNLDQEIARSTSSWGIGWFPSVERFNLRHSTDQGNKNEPKWSRNEARTRGEKMKNAKNTTWTHKSISPPNPGGHKEDSRPPFPCNLGSYTNLNN